MLLRAMLPVKPCVAKKASVAETDRQVRPKRPDEGSASHRFSAFRSHENGVDSDVIPASETNARRKLR